MDERHHQNVTTSGKTVDEAIEEAVRALGVAREELDITVITEGKPGGFLGRGAEQARILAVILPDSKPVPSAMSVQETGRRLPIAVDSKRDIDGRDNRYDDEEKVEVDRDEVAGLAKDILENLLRHMDITAVIKVREGSDPIVLDVASDDGGLLIGRRGETLSSLQYLVNVLVGKKTRGWTKVVIDIEGWRTRREDTLRTLAQRQAARVREQQAQIALDPMSASERRIVHMALQDEPDIETHSEGDEPYRHLVIKLKQ